MIDVIKIFELELNEYIAVTIYRGIMNELIFILSDNYNNAFNELLNYYSKKGDKLGWFDEDGHFENDMDWDFTIKELEEIKLISSGMQNGCMKVNEN